MSNASFCPLNLGDQQLNFQKISFRRLTLKNHNFLIVSRFLLILAATVSFLKVFSEYEGQNSSKFTEFSRFHDFWTDPFLLVVKITFMVQDLIKTLPINTTTNLILLYTFLGCHGVLNITNNGGFHEDTTKNP